MDHLEDVFRLLEKATLLEKYGQRIEASTKYYEGCHLMRQIISRFPDGTEKDPVVVLLREKIKVYTLRAQRLYFDDSSIIQPATNRAFAPATITLASTDEISVLSLPGNQSSVNSQIHRKVGVANAKLEEAIRLEEQHKNDSSNLRNKEIIIQSYLSAAEIYLSVAKLSEESSLSLPPVVQRRLEACLERAETLKRSVRKQRTAAENKMKGLR
jgi:hypothetical protein